MAGQRVRVNAQAIAAAAAESGRIPPWRRGYWTARVGQGGQAGARAVAELLAASPAPPEVIARWDAAAPAGPALAAAAREPTAEEVYSALYPTAEQYAQAQVGREPNRLEQVEQRLPRAAAGAAPAHEPVTNNHARLTVPEHEHPHADYNGGVHTHPHGHADDANHEPGTNDLHIHPAAAAARPRITDPVAAGIAARERARAAAGRPPYTDEQLYRSLFGGE